MVRSSTLGWWSRQGRIALVSTLAALSLVGFEATRARATVMVEVSIERLFAEADLVIHGRVMRSGARLVLHDDGTSMPHTLTEVEVLEVFRGPAAERVVIDELGGEVQGLGSWIAGTPRYRRGEECIVFLRAIGSGRYRTYGMAQGHFEVRPGVPGVAPSVVRDVSEIGVARWSGDQMRVEHGPVSHMPLADFLRYLRQLAEALRVDGMPSSPVGAP